MPRKIIGLEWDRSGARGRRRSRRLPSGQPGPRGSKTCAASDNNRSEAIGSRGDPGPGARTIIRCGVGIVRSTERQENRFAAPCRRRPPRGADRCPAGRPTLCCGRQDRRRRVGLRGAEFACVPDAFRVRFRRSLGSAAHTSSGKDAFLTHWTTDRFSSGAAESIDRLIKL